ncbi:MAG: carbon-nitrogen hydrolase family protein [Candidatus Omnitrophica bacterium]|nr:carbon-nitrogen hydrolase family protein [Candidatus Omnitrophota bacterium]
MSRLVGVSSLSFDNAGVEKKIDKRIKAWENLIDTASLDKPDIILLPEHFLFTGMVYKKTDVAELLPGGKPITKFLSRKARQHKIHIFASYYRKDKKGIYNSAVLFGRKGKIVGVYDKTFPVVEEMSKDGILPGKGAKVFPTDFGRIGAMICFDFNFRELFAGYKSKGVELICFLSAFRAGFMIPAAAFENQVFIASSTPGENSVIVDPLGRTLAESSMYGKIIFSKINLDSKVIHIDYNQQKMANLKKKYKEYVRVEVASPEAVYFLSSFHPKKSVEEMIKEFKIETFDEYLNRARKERKKHLL